MLVALFFLAQLHLNGNFSRALPALVHVPAETASSLYPNDVIDFPLQAGSFASSLKHSAGVFASLASNSSVVAAKKKEEKMENSILQHTVTTAR